MDNQLNILDSSLKVVLTSSERFSLSCDLVKISISKSVLDSRFKLMLLELHLIKVRPKLLLSNVLYPILSFQEKNNKCLIEFVCHFQVKFDCIVS